MLARGVILASPLDGTGPPRHQTVSSLAGPVVGRRSAEHRPLELGHDIACQQLIAVKHLVPRRPVDGLHQEAAVSAAFLCQLLDALDAVVWCPDKPITGIGHKVYDLVQWTIEDR